MLITGRSGRNGILASIHPVSPWEPSVIEDLNSPNDTLIGTCQRRIVTTMNIETSPAEAAGNSPNGTMPG
jgi:hypothetical protein